MPIRPQMLGHLGFQNLIQHRFNQLFHSFAIILHKVLQMFGIQGNVEFGHRFLQVENGLFRQRPFSGKTVAFFNFEPI